MERLVFVVPNDILSKYFADFLHSIENGEQKMKPTAHPRNIPHKMWRGNSHVSYSTEESHRTVTGVLNHLALWLINEVALARWKWLNDSQRFFKRQQAAYWKFTGGLPLLNQYSYQQITLKMYNCDKVARYLALVSYCGLARDTKATTQENYLSDSARTTETKSRCV